MIQDQYNELDTVNNRISLLVAACKVVGVYDRSATGVQRMLQEGFDNQLIPVDNWAMFAEKNGLKGQVDWLPLEAVITALQRLYEAREAIKGQIYELTGIADIVRGASKASETLGAQQIKAQFASVRIKKLQDEVARFASEVMRIKAEIMVKHFSPEILIKKSNVTQTENQEYIGPAIQLLKSQEGFEWRITIGADTLAQADYAMEKADRLAFLTSVSSYMQQMIPMVTTMPQMASLLINILKWSVAGFRNARDIEGTLDRALDNIAKQPPQNKGPSPEEVKAQAEQQKMQQEMQMTQQKAQLEAQSLQMENQFKQQAAQMEMQLAQQKAFLDAQQQQADMRAEQQSQQMEMLRLTMELDAEKRRLALEAQSQQMELAFQQAMNALKLDSAQDQAEVKLETAKAQASAKKESE
jgi:hypothetical protein